MLPGLRFLFAATLISASLLVFGMGAIALMRASHQQFASMPPRQPPEPVFAQAPQTMPSLSMLRVEPKSEVLPPAPRDVSPEPERSASLTNAERAIDPPAPPVISEPKISEPAPETRSEAEPVPEARPPAEKPQDANVAMREAPPAPEAIPETAPSPPAQIAATPQADATVATGSIAMPEDQLVVEAPVADPPLPQARPEIAVVSPVAEPARARVTPKPVVKRKVRKSKTKRHRAKTEKLPAVSSAPTLGSLFSSSSN